MKGYDRMIDDAAYRKTVDELARLESECLSIGWDISTGVAWDMIAAFPVLAAVLYANFLQFSFIWGLLLTAGAIACFMLIFIKLFLDLPPVSKKFRICYGALFIVTFFLFSYGVIGDVVYIWLPAGGFIVCCVQSAVCRLNERRKVIEYNKKLEPCERLSNELISRKASLPTDDSSAQRCFWWEGSLSDVEEYSEKYAITLGTGAKLNWQAVTWWTHATAVIRNKQYAFMPLADSMLTDSLAWLESTHDDSEMASEESKVFTKALNSYRFYICKGTAQIAHTYDANTGSSRDPDSEVEEKMRKWDERLDTIERLGNEHMLTNKEQVSLGYKEYSPEMQIEMDYRDNARYLHEHELREKSERDSAFRRTPTRTYYSTEHYDAGYCITTDEQNPRLLGIITILDNGFMGDLSLLKYAIYRIPGITFDIYQPTPVRGNNLYQAYAAYIYKQTQLK